MGITFFNRHTHIPGQPTSTQDKLWVLIAGGGPWLDLLVRHANLNATAALERVQRSDDALALALVCRYDVIVIGQRCDLDAASLCTRMRDAGIDSPILAVAEDAAAHAVVHALDAGADAYLVGPATWEEFVARLQSLQRHPVLVARRNDAILRVVSNKHIVRQDTSLQEVQQ